MNKYFDVKDRVYDITQKYPETIDVFSANGFEQLKNEAMRKTIGKTISVEMACSMKKINLELFETKLVDIIKQTRESEDVFLNHTDRNDEAEVTVLGVLPCPVRIPLMESFKEWIDKNKDISLDYELKAANTGVEWIRDSIKNATEENITDLFMSAGFDLFFDEELMGKFKKKGVFEDMSGFERLNKDFDNKEISLTDPAGQYSVISVVPAVFLVNTDELNGRKMPLSWGDLLSDDFERSISLPLNDFDLFNALLLSIYKEFGEEGVRKLGRAQDRKSVV